MPESDKFHHQTDYHGSASGFFFSGSAGLNINLLVTDFNEAFSALMQLKSISTLNQSISAGQENSVQNTVERFEKALYQLSFYQKMVNELKEVHNMLELLEGALILLDRTIQRNLRRIASLNNLESSLKKDLVDESWAQVREIWIAVVVPRIKNLERFASMEMEFMEEPRLVMINTSTWSGPKWILWLLERRESFEASFKERNEKIHELSSDILDDCRDHLANIDQRLRDALNQLNPIFDQILRSISSGPVNF